MSKENLYKCDIEMKINITEDPKDLITIYQQNKGFFFEIASKLLTLKKFGYFITLWNEEIKLLQTDSKKLIQILFSIKQSSKELCESGEADTLIRNLLDLTNIYGNTFETYKICCAISDLVIHNRQFPSKATAIMYFQRISAIFKSSNKIIPYLNALHILNELDKSEMSLEELQYLKKFSNIKIETGFKELFCGVKMKDLDSIVLTLNHSEFQKDAMIETAIQAFENNTPLELTFENISFLLRRSICFKIELGQIRIIPSSNLGFTSVVFDISKRFEFVKDEIIDENPGYQREIRVEKPKVVIQKKQTVKPKKPVFKNRFAVPYKNLKLIKMYCKLDFEDIHFEQRNKIRQERIFKQLEQKENEYKMLIPYKPIVEDLLEQLNMKIQEKEENERKEMLARAKEEEERALKERMSKMWRNQEKEKQIERNISATNVTLENSSTNDGIYRPKFNTLNFTESNIMTNTKEIYRPPKTFLNKENTSGDHPSPKTPWRSKKSENSSNK